jgi:hypothetical protein
MHSAQQLRRIQKQRSALLVTPVVILCRLLARRAAFNGCSHLTAVRLESRRNLHNLQQCLPVTAAAAFAFMRVAGGPHSGMHASVVPLLSSTTCQSRRNKQGMECIGTIFTGGL